MELKSTLKVFNEADLPSVPAAVEGQTRKLLAGSAEHSSERMRVSLVSVKTGTVEHLHWHLVEAFHYVISGRAIMRDIEGKTYNIGPGSVIYAPPGIVGSHEWEIEEEMQLIAVRATTDPERNLQFTVDDSTKESKIELDQLVARGVANFRKSLY